MYDLIIKSGNVVDGTEKPGYIADVAISGGKIADIAENITEESKKTIDAYSLTVTPGFIDSHSHSDDALFDYPDMTEKIEQGITTSIAGQCGMSIAPIAEDVRGEKDYEIKGFGMASEVLKTFGSMADAVKDIPLGSNVKAFVGHGALRSAVLGYKNRKPTEAEMIKMKNLLRDAMENGAAGLSFGLIYTPGCYADTDELIELAKVVKEYDGVLSAHLRNEGFELLQSVEEYLKIIKTVGIKAVFSHHKSMYQSNWGKVNRSLEMIKEAIAQGYDIYCDVYPYEASSTDLVTTIVAKELRDLNREGIVRLVSERAMREKIKELYVCKNGKSLSNLLVVKCEGYPEYEGMRIDKIAELRNQDDFEAAFDIITDSGAVVDICNFCINPEDIETVLKFERTMMCTDASVAKGNRVYHPRLKGTFPRVLGRYVREKKVMTIEEAIRRCTSMPAEVYGLTGKGVIRKGYDADICIFDSNVIIDRADYTACDKRCEGLNFVILGGEVVAENAVYNGKKKGRLIF